MISNPHIATDPFERDRLLVVGGRLGNGTLLDDLRARYPDWTIATSDSYLAGIAELARHPARAVLACVEGHAAQLHHAVAGLREAAGEKTRLILCCTPDTEPIARGALESGADDYIIDPPDGDELDAVIGVASMPAAADARLAAAPAATMEELAQLAETLAGIEDAPRALLERVATLVRTALCSKGATVVVEGAVATCGDAVSKPVLSAPLTTADGITGQLSVGERLDGAYTPGDVEKLTHYATVVGHILEAASRHRRWRQLAVTDECSGLPNRRYVNDQLEEILARAKAEHFPVTLLLFDVDDFKRYNDTYGHDAGDEVIRVTGELFRKHCRAQDIVARYGGDEFAVLFWDPEGPRVAGSKHPDCALAVLERFTEALRAKRLSRLGPAAEGRLTISGGLATFPWDASTPQELFKRADDALLAAKRAGKNRVFLIGEAERLAP